MGPTASVQGQGGIQAHARSVVHCLAAPLAAVVPGIVEMALMKAGEIDSLFQMTESYGVHTIPFTYA